MVFEGYKCSQCGAKDFIEEGKDKLRCNYCKSLFFIDNNSDDFSVIIEKGAEVVFKPSADVTILGKLKIEDGAEVELNGKITLIEKSSDNKIRKAKLRLKN